MIKDIAFTAYPAKDVKALRAFYTDALGLNFTAAFEQEGALMYDEAKVGNGFFAIATTQWMEDHPGQGIAFEVDDIEKTAGDLRSRNIEIGEIHDTPVCRIGSFTDPEGNQVTLHQTTVPH